MFWNKKEKIDSNEYKALSEGITALDYELRRLKNRMDLLEIQQNDVIKKILKKIKPQESAEEEIEDTAKYKTMDNFNFLRGTIHQNH